MRSLSSSVIVTTLLVTWQTNNSGSGPTVHAFAPSSIISVDANRLIHNRRVIQQQAIIYGADGEIVKEETSSALDRTLDDLSSSLLDSLSSEVSMASLVHMACSFAPPPHNGMHPRDVVSAQLVHVDQKQMNIAVATRSRDGESLVQVLIPVSFPEPIDDDKVSSVDAARACILKMVCQLDTQALERIQKKEAQQMNREETDRRRRILQQLQEEPAGDQLPSWWTFPELKITLADECKSLKTLLNEDDFADDVLALLQMHDPSPVGRVLKSCVAAVGPSGLLLRGYVQKVLTYNDDDDEEEAQKRFAIVEVPIPFPKAAGTVDMLQITVLDLVESVDATSAQAEHDAKLALIAKEAVMEKAKLVEHKREQETQDVGSEKEPPKTTFATNETFAEDFVLVTDHGLEKANTDESLLSDSKREDQEIIVESKSVSLDVADETTVAKEMEHNKTTTIVDISKEKTSDEEVEEKTLAEEASRMDEVMTKKKSIKDESEIDADNQKTILLGKDYGTGELIQVSDVQTEPEQRWEAVAAATGEDATLEEEKADGDKITSSINITVQVESKIDGESAAGSDKNVLSADSEAAVGKSTESAGLEKEVENTTDKIFGDDEDEAKAFETQERSKLDAIVEARRQPKSPEEEARLAKKYASIADLGERAFTILKDLGMI